MRKWQFKEVMNASKSLVSYAFSRQSLTNSLSDLSETVAYAQQRTDLQTAFTEARIKDTSRYQGNFWLSAYQTLHNDFQYGVKRCRDVASACAALNDGAEAFVAQLQEAPLTGKIQADLQESGKQLSNLPWMKKLHQVLKEEIGEELAYWGCELNSQKELLLDTLRGLVDDHHLPSVEYFVDHLIEEIDTEESKLEDSVSSPQRQIDNSSSLVEKSKQWGQYAWQRARQDSRFLSERLGYLVLDTLEMEAEKNNPPLAQALAAIRQKGTHRVASHKLCKIAEAVSIVMTTLQEQGRQLQEVLAETQIPAVEIAVASRS